MLLVTSELCLKLLLPRIMAMQIFLTIFSGAAVFVLGQIMLKMIIEPAQELKKTIARVKMEIHRLNFEIHNFTVIDTNSKVETINTLKNLSAELLANNELILCYWIASRIFKIPNKKRINEASLNLIHIINAMSLPPESQTAQILVDKIPHYIDQIKENLNFLLITGYEELKKEDI